MEWFLLAAVLGGFFAVRWRARIVRHDAEEVIEAAGDLLERLAKAGELTTSEARRLNLLYEMACRPAWRIQKTLRLRLRRERDLIHEEFWQ